MMRRGFTVVELLIVIVVVGILATLTIISYGGVQENARIAKAQQFESQLLHRYGAYATGRWNFDDCSGSSVRNDALGTSDTITGTATWITSTPSGSGCALTFNGATRIETQADLKSSFYVKSAWVRLQAAPCTASNNVISQAVSGGANAAFYIPSCSIQAGHNGAWGTINPGINIGDGKWHHLALIWETGVLKLYVDGALRTSANAAAAPSPLGYVAIGAHSGGNYLVGDIDNPFVASY